MTKKHATPAFDIISIGDTSLDAFLMIDRASLLCSLDKTTCWFCLNYAEKIPVQELHFSLGGNACNNAVGSARLGLKTALYTVLGDDDSGRRIMDRIKEEGVAHDYLQVEKNNPTNYSTVLSYKTERTILVYHDLRPYKLPALQVAKWIYFTSMGKGFEKVFKALVKYLNSNGTKLAFNPGTHQLLAGKKVLEPILRITNVLILNKEEAISLVGAHPMTPIQEIMRDLRSLGPELVVVTDGNKGAFGFDGRNSYRMPPVPAKVVERTGAGDAFSTGLISALAYNLPLSEALMWGAANAASVIEKIGPQAGLLTKEQMMKRCKTCGKKSRKI
ncbi:carbohydrate kinase family protein [Candidatus Uhrbacteria bacterium]|nr:carbohydrate kinase family protein [Candidatus Uhrbacteria bacterium]